MLLAASVLALFLVSSVSAYSVWEPQYEQYRLGANHYSNGAYSSVSTYEKTVVENEDRYGSDSVTTVKKTESETYTPIRTSSRYRYYDDEYDYYNDRYDRPRYIYTDSYGRTKYYDADDYEVRNYDTYIVYDDGNVYPSSNWRFKEVYHNYDYPNENDYGYDYYYEPRYDWHQSVFNWRY